MRIWVDADACPNAIKAILFRAADRRQVGVTLVANSRLSHPASTYIDAVQVEAGPDVADAYIIAHASTGDLAITADIPLAAEMIEKGCFALNPRGEMYSSDNVRNALSVRNFMDDLRSAGIASGGPSPFSAGDRQRFANQLDRFLTKQVKPR